MIELTFPKEFMLVKQVHQKGIIVTWYFFNYSF